MTAPTAVGAAAIVVFEAALAAGVAWRVSGSVVGADPSRPLRIVTGLVVGLSQVIGIQMLCAALDVLYVPVVFALHLAVAVAVWRRVPTAKGRRAAAESAKIAPSSAFERAPKPSPDTVLRAALGAVIAFVTVLALGMSTKVPTDPDSRQYHIPNAASWFQVHNLWHLPATNPGFFTNGYPSNGELITSWLIQPLHRAQWAALPQVVYGLAILAGAALISDELGGSPRRGLLAATAILVSPVSWTSQVGTAFTDWISLSGLVMAVGLVLHARNRREPHWVLLAGLALGIAAGSKDTAVLPAVFVIGLGVSALPVGRRVRGGLLMMAGIASLAGVWFVRNAIQAGNPLYPEPVHIAGRTLLRGGVGPITAWSSSILKDAFSGNTHPLKIWIESFAVWVGPAILVCAGAALCVARWKRWDIRSVLAAIAAVWFLIYMATPYTGPGSFPLLILSQVRYALPPMVLAGVCACVESEWFAAVAWAAVGYDLWTVLHGVHLAAVPDAVMATPGATLVVVALVSAAVMAAFLATLDPARLGSAVAGASPFARGAAALALAVVVCTAISLVAVRHVPAPSRLDLALAAAGREDGAVMIDGDGDVLGAMGDKLQHHVVSAAGGGAPHQAPLSNPALLDARVRSVVPVAVIVGPANWPGVFPGWAPRGYRLLYSESGRRIYVIDTVAGRYDRPVSGA